MLLASLLKGILVCALALCFGGTLIWRGITGDIWRSQFTGDAVVPRWLYIASGIGVILLAVGWTVVAALLSKA